MDAFRVLLIEGIFYEREGVLLAQLEEGGPSPVDVVNELEPLKGEMIILALHHAPPHPINEKLRGGGCCFWQKSECPAGHHKNPAFLLNISGQGVLDRNEDKWRILMADGSSLDIPLELLIGHRSRLVATTVFDIARMKESLGGITPESVEALGTQAENIRDTLERLRSIMGKKEE